MADTNKVLFKFGSQEAYDALTTYERNALYFIENTNRLYKGSVLMSKPYLIVKSVPDPSTALEDVFYVIIKDNVASVYVKCEGSMIPLAGGQIETGSIKDLDVFDEDLLSTSKDTLGDSDSKLVTEGAVKKAIENAIKEADKDLEDIKKSLIWSKIEE